MDINAWDRLLTTKEMENWSDCKGFEHELGNMANMNSDFNITGPLVEPVENEDKEFDCEENFREIIIPVRQTPLKIAQQQCDKFIKGSIGPNFKDLEKSPVITLSGMCDRTAFDKYYHLYNDELGNVIYYGFSGSVIRYDEEQRRWVLSIENKKNTKAVSNAEFPTLVIGNHDWEIPNDFDCFSWYRGTAAQFQFMYLG